MKKAPTIEKVGMGDVLVRPAAYEKALRNPLMGFRGGPGHEWATLMKHYIKWNEIERSAGDGVEAIREFCDAEWAELPRRNMKVIPRVYLEWPKADYSDSDKFWPDDMQPGDYSSEQFRQRTVRLIENLAEAWDNDPRVAFVETGILGYWGEQHSPEPTPTMEALLGDTFTRCFRNKLCMIRYPLSFREYGFGVYWDSWGTTVDTPLMIEALLTPPYLGRWKTAPMGGEVSYNYGNPPGADPTDGVVNHVRWIEDLIYRLHWNHLGWIDQYDASNPEAQAGAARLQRAFGYRFEIETFRYPGRLSPGWTGQVSLTLRNVGSTPLYENWPLEISLLDPATKEPVIRQRVEGVDARAWLPGDRWVWWAREYEVKPEAHTVACEFALPADLPKGTYIVALSLLDPGGYLPAVRFATTSYFRGGRHPMGLIGVGVDVEDPSLDPAEFDEPLEDDTLCYEAP